MGDEEKFQSFEEFSKSYTLEDIVLTIFLLPQAEFLSSSPPKKRLLVIPWLPPGQEQIQHVGRSTEDCNCQSFWRRPATDINPAFSVVGHFSLSLFHKFVRNVALWHIFEGAWNIIKYKDQAIFLVSGGTVTSQRQQPQPVAAEGENIAIDDLIQPPGRYMRPPKLVIIFRGLPGSGKSFIAKVIEFRQWTSWTQGYHCFLYVNVATT